MKLSCKFGFDLAGSEISYCDGERWDRELGECRPDIGHKKVCDFETADLCGWTQNQWENDFLWRRRNGWNAIGKLKFGPKHDHTVHSLATNCQSNATIWQKKKFSLISHCRRENRWKATIWLQKAQMHWRSKNHDFGRQSIGKQTRWMHASAFTITCLALMLDGFGSLSNRSIEIWMKLPTIKSNVCANAGSKPFYRHRFFVLVSITLKMSIRRMNGTRDFSTWNRLRVIFKLYSRRLWRVDAFVTLPLTM